MSNEAFRERYESLVEKRIREAQERGEFDDLPGAGKPLRGLHGPDDPDWWLRGYVRRQGVPTDVLLPTPLRLRKEIERLPETVRGLGTERAVRDAVAELAGRVAAWRRAPDGPRVDVRMPAADDVVARWRADCGLPREGSATHGATTSVPRAAVGDVTDPDSVRPPLARRDRLRRGFAFLRRRR